MVDMTQTITAKSDQLNSDDLIGGSITVKITKVTGTGEKDQPIAINYEGDNNKPFKPCKTVRRILVGAWGADGASYVGRSMTLYRDPEVIFGGAKVGGIRVSHLSHIQKPLTLALAANKASKKSVTVQPLATPVAAEIDVVKLREDLTFAAVQGNDALSAAWKALTPAEQKAAVPFKEELKVMATESDTKE